MKTPIKIILLVVAMLLAIGGVMAYYETIVSPPRKFDFKNQYYNSDKKDISKVKSSNTDLALDSIYVAIMHELDFQVANSLLTDQECNELLELFATQYVPLFIDRCNKAFESSVWDTPQWSHGFMLSRAAEIKNFRSSNGNYIIERNSKHIKELNKIENIISKYNSAWNFVNNASKCSSVAEIKSLKTSADKFRTQPLSKCTKLMQSLNSVESTAKANLASNIASFCNNIANRWRAYGSYPKWLSAYDGACSRINEYTKAFGASGILSQSKSKLEIAKQSALEYYD